jgi:hypothetical protein
VDSELLNVMEVGNRLMVSRRCAARPHPVTRAYGEVGAQTTRVELQYRDVRLNVASDGPASCPRTSVDMAPTMAYIEVRS